MEGITVGLGFVGILRHNLFRFFETTPPTYCNTQSQNLYLPSKVWRNMLLPQHISTWTAVEPSKRFPSSNSRHLNLGILASVIDLEKWVNTSWITQRYYRFLFVSFFSSKMFFALFSVFVHAVLAIRDYGSVFKNSFAMSSWISFRSKINKVLLTLSVFYIFVATTSSREF